MSHSVYWEAIKLGSSIQHNAIQSGPSIIL